MHKQDNQQNSIPDYTRIYFDPRTIESFRPPTKVEALGDRSDGAVYVYDEKIILAVNVALACGRPLLVRGPSGCGKSSLAKNIARTKEWPYYEFVVNSRSESRDLLWQFDTLRRLADAQVAGSRPPKEDRTGIGPSLLPNEAYVQPGVLWWAIDPLSALHRGADTVLPGVLPASDPARFGPKEAGQNLSDQTAVVLIDEIDKADPDFPNNLLVPLGSYQFTLQETQAQINLSKNRRVLVIVTTNNERELPAAFLRRCVVLELPAPGEDRLEEIGKAHFEGDDEAQPLLGPVAKELFKVVKGDVSRSLKEPSAAEYLDAVAACARLGITVGSDRFNEMVGLTLRKRWSGAGT